MPIHESGEMYLETILILKNEGNTVREIDIAKYMGYSKPAVSRALNKLRENAMIVVDGNGYIDFTDAGKEIADKIYRKHIVFAEFIMRLGVDEETAVADACKIEHVISDKTFEAILRHAENH